MVCYQPCQCTICHFVTSNLIKISRSKPLGVADIHSESSEKLSPRPSNAVILTLQFSS